MEANNAASPPPAPSTPRTHRRNPSKFASPINLPIRTDEIPAPTPKRLTPSPGFKPSPRRSFYLERALPVSGDDPLALPDTHDPSLSQDPTLRAVSSTTQDTDLIFDDGDDRLPPPEASPTFRPNLQADILAVSSPTLSPGAAAQLDESDYEDGAEYSLQLINDRRRNRSGTSVNEPEQRPRRGSTPISLSGVSLAESTSTYYPTPIPSQLMRPPRLSKKPAQRKSSLPMEDLPVPPQWGPSPLEDAVPYTERLDSLDRLNGGLSMDGFNVDLDGSAHASDVDSDRATIMSDDREGLDDVSDDEHGAEEQQRETKGHKRRSWLPKIFQKKSSRLPDVQKDEMGEKYDAIEAQTLMAQMAVLDNDVAFSKLDPEAIQRHSQMFDAGGVHSGIVPHSGGPTSLIEELEIRKAGKRIQKQVFSREVREMERQRAEDARLSKNFHPADLVNNTQPTLMQMQYMAEADYDARIKWHTRAINRHYINEHANETLAQRRARLKGEKSKAQHSGAPETLAQRRQRLRREKEAAAMKEAEQSLGFDEPVRPSELVEPVEPVEHDMPVDSLLQDDGHRPTISAV